MTHDYMPHPKPYALYLHGMGSGARSGTRPSLEHYLPDYEWLAPELPLDPQAALAVADDYAHVFEPALVVGTSMGGLLAVLADAPGAVKAVVNPAWNIDTAMRRAGYGRHAFHCEREDGATEYTIDEPLCQAYAHLRDTTPAVAGRAMVALFASDDEFIGREPAKRNAAKLSELGYTVEWTSKCGHRLNQAAAKQLAQLVKTAAEKAC